MTGLWEQPVMTAVDGIAMPVLTLCTLCRDLSDCDFCCCCACCWYGLLKQHHVCHRLSRRDTCTTRLDTYSPFFHTNELYFPALFSGYPPLLSSILISIDKSILQTACCLCPGHTGSRHSNFIFPDQQDAFCSRVLGSVRLVGSVASPIICPFHQSHHGCTSKEVSAANWD